MNLYRELEMNELEKAIKEALISLSNFINDESSRPYIKLLQLGEYDKAISLADKEIQPGYGHVVHKAKMYLKAKEMMVNGKVLYTEMLNTDTVL